MAPRECRPGRWPDNGILILEVTAAGRVRLAAADLARRMRIEKVDDVLTELVELGANVIKGKVTYKAVAEAFDIAYTPIAEFL
jgi:alanine dehydrogenase